jgi:hypothetical protein
VALLVAYGQAPVTLAVNAFWLALLLGTGTVAAYAAGRPARAALAGEIVLAAIVVQALWSTALLAAGNARRAADESGPVLGVSWHLAFSSLDQAAAKVLPRPEGWALEAVYLRVDVSRPYAGKAGFLVTVNGRLLGELNEQTRDQHVGTQGIPSWAMRVPRDVLATSALVRVVLQPTAVDPALSLPGHGDPRVEPLGEANSWFFDGRRWANDRLAGPGAPARGTYRIWLWPALGEPA